jgi:hypothetical protein
MQCDSKGFLLINACGFVPCRVAPGLTFGRCDDIEAMAIYQRASSS